ncbi:hypothetical protein B0H13DRAFT_2339587 [Mycena leptocephala]|nr:hypothetical protein B0H13DRAFT_2339587 [Mycena leptocephala]
MFCSGTRLRVSPEFSAGVFMLTNAFLGIPLYLVHFDPLFYIPFLPSILLYSHDTLLQFSPPRRVSKQALTPALLQLYDVGPLRCPRTPWGRRATGWVTQYLDIAPMCHVVYLRMGATWAV